MDFHCDLLQDATWPPRAGVRKKNDQKPTLKKVGKFIGLAKDAKKFGLQDLELLKMFFFGIISHWLIMVNPQGNGVLQLGSW